MLGPVEAVAEVDSTNSALFARARAGAPGGVVLVADHQTAGRGRLGRVWEAEPGAALLVSVLLRPALEPGQVHLVTAAAGIAAVQVVRAMGGDVALKWPNDVVAGDAKLAGLLSESVVAARRVAAVVVGMGLNLRSERLPPGATSLAQLLDRQVPRDEVLLPWLTRFEVLYEALLRPGGVRSTVEAMQAVCGTVGRRVRVELASGTLVGAAVGLGDQGGLVVVTDDGERHEVLTGDVVHLRHAEG